MEKPYILFETASGCLVGLAAVVLLFVIAGLLIFISAVTFYVVLPLLLVGFVLAGGISYFVDRIAERRKK